MKFLEIIDLNGESNIYNLEKLSDVQLMTVISNQAEKYFNGFSTDPLRKQPKLFPVPKKN